MHFACLIGDLDVVKALLTFDHIQGSAAQVTANQSTGGGAIELCPKNSEGLLPIHLAIARGHFFVVQHLLSLE